MTDWHQSSAGAPRPQLVTLGAVAVVVTGAAAGFALTHWYMQRQPEPSDAGNGASSSVPAASRSAWQWPSWGSSRQAKALEMSSERLAVLARSAEAIEVAQRVPLEKRTSLAGLDCR